VSIILLLPLISPRDLKMMKEKERWSGMGSGRRVIGIRKG
jgi:hypothetical protein